MHYAYRAGVISGAVVGAAIGVVLWMKHYITPLEPEKAPELAFTLVNSDQILDVLVKTRIGQGTNEDREIDLRNPSDGDRYFLLQTLRDGPESARKSATRALVEIYEIRAVPELLRRKGSVREEEFYCAAGLELLRKMEKAAAAELYIDARDDTAAPITPTCTRSLADKEAAMGIGEPAVVVALLGSERPRARKYALRNLLPTGEPSIEARVKELATGTDGEERGLAGRWLERAAGKTSISDSGGHSNAPHGTP